MAERTGSLEYDRATLEELSVSETREYERVDLEQVHQIIAERFDAELETTTTGTDGELSRLTALVDTGQPDSRSVRYKPYGPHGAMAVVIGLIAALPTVFLSLLVSLIGYYFYRKERDGEMPIKRWHAIDVLLTGANPSDDESNSEGSVTIAVTPAVGVDTDRLEGISWARRKAIVGRVSRWAEQVLGTGPAKRNDEDAFFDHMTMWLKRNSEADVDAIDSDQTQLLLDPSDRRSYAELVTGGDGIERDDEREIRSELEAGLAAELEAD